jgi:hypothetical protein
LLTTSQTRTAVRYFILLDEFGSILHFLFSLSAVYRYYISLFHKPKTHYLFSVIHLLVLICFGSQGNTGNTTSLVSICFRSCVMVFAARAPLMWLGAEWFTCTLHIHYIQIITLWAMGKCLCVSRVLHGEMEVLQLICVILPSRLAVDLFNSNTH